MRIKERHAWVDSTRGVAILGVVCIHVCGAFLYQTPSRLTPGTWWFLSVLTSASKDGVPLFLMLSGAVNLGSPKKNEIDGAYFRRLLRILIPFASIVVSSTFYDVEIASVTGVSVENE